MISELTLTLHESSDTDDGTVRLDQSDMRLLGILSGDILALSGSRTTYACARPAFMEDRNQRLAKVSPLLRRNLGVQAAQKIQILPQLHKPALAERITLQVDDDIDNLHVLARQRQLPSAWHGRCVVEGDLLRVPTLDRQPLLVKVTATSPGGLIQIGSSTEFGFVTSANDETLPGIGALRETYRTCHALATTRLKTNIPTATHAVLLTGPAGCGKARLVTRLAQDLDVSLVTLDAHQLLDRQQAQGGALDISLTALARRGPTILLLDHLDALTFAVKQSPILAAAQHTVTAQLSGLLDELPGHANIIVFGIASAPLEARLRDHPSISLTLPVDAPGRPGRHEILLLETRNLPLAESVDLARLAAMTPGATARDLRHLVTTTSLLATNVKITENDFVTAYRPMQPSATERTTLVCDIPSASLWDDVAGLEDIKRMMRETLNWSTKHYDKFRDAGVRPPRSVLLSGGTGTGKTSLVRALAGITPMHLIELSCPVLAAGDPADTARHIRDGFAMARRKTPCVIFLDDIDVLFETDPPVADSSNRLPPAVAQLLTDMDSLAMTQGVVVIAATNRPDRLTSDILRPGRFDFAVTLPLPDGEARKKILQIHAHKLPLAADVDFDVLANATKNMAPAEIANLCNRAGLMALSRSLSDESGGVIPPMVNAALFEQILRGRKS